MFPGIDRSEIQRCMEIRDPIRDGSVRHIVNFGQENERNALICRLVSTDEWIRQLRANGSHRRGVVRISWAPGESIMFTMSFPRRELEIYKKGKKRYARVPTAKVKLFVHEGSTVKRMLLGDSPKYIDFGSSLNVVPLDLCKAAAAYVEPALEPEPSVA